MSAHRRGSQSQFAARRRRCLWHASHRGRGNHLEQSYRSLLALSTTAAERIEGSGTRTQIFSLYYVYIEHLWSEPRPFTFLQNGYPLDRQLSRSSRSRHHGQKRRSGRSTKGEWIEANKQGSVWTLTCWQRRPGEWGRRGLVKIVGFWWSWWSARSIVLGSFHTMWCTDCDCLCLWTVLLWCIGVMHLKVTVNSCIRIRFTYNNHFVRQFSVTESWRYRLLID